MYRMEILNFHTPKIYPILDVKLPDSCRCVWQITKQKKILVLNKQNSNCIFYDKKMNNWKVNPEVNINWR